MNSANVTNCVHWLYAVEIGDMDVDRLRHGGHGSRLGWVLTQQAYPVGRLPTSAAPAPPIRAEPTARRSSPGPRRPSVRLARGAAAVRHRDAVGARVRTARAGEGVDLLVRAHRPGSAAHRPCAELGCDRHRAPLADAQRV